MLGKDSSVTHTQLINMLSRLEEAAYSELQSSDAAIRRTISRAFIGDGELLCTYEAIFEFNAVQFYYSATPVVLDQAEDPMLLHVGGYQLVRPPLHGH